MKRLIAITTCVIALVAVTLIFTATSVAGEQGGPAVFKAKKCNTCHSVSTAGIKATTKSSKMSGPDLVNLAETYKADWISAYVRKEADLDGKNHKKPFKGSDEELQVLVDWLLEQKAEG